MSTSSVTQETEELSRPLLRGWFHVVGLVASVIAGPLLVFRGHGVAQRAVLSFYSASLVALFGVSTAYHRVRWSPIAKRRIRRVDHVTIFLAIAGTYTAVAELALSGWAKVLILCLVWIGATIGIGIRQLWLDAPKKVTAIPYVVVGWSAVAVLPQLDRSLGTTGFALIIVGGAFYTAGAIVYGLRKPNPIPRIMGFHEIFHACTVVGATSQYLAIFFALTRK